MWEILRIIIKRVNKIKNKNQIYFLQDFFIFF